jgi:hypothetical protein
MKDQTNDYRTVEQFAQLLTVPVALQDWLLRANPYQTICEAGACQTPLTLLCDAYGGLLLDTDGLWQICVEGRIFATFVPSLWAQRFLRLLHQTYYDENQCATRTITVADVLPVFGTSIGMIWNGTQWIPDERVICDGCKQATLRSLFQTTDPTMPWFCRMCCDWMSAIDALAWQYRLGLRD